MPGPSTVTDADAFARGRERNAWFWRAGFVATAVAFAWPFVRHFPNAQVSVLAQNIADACLLEHVLARVWATGASFLDWKLTQAPYVFPDYPLVAGLTALFGVGTASAAYPLLFCTLASIAWGWYFKRARAAPAAIAFLVAIVFGMLWFDNAAPSPAATYVYLFLPGHHAAFTLLAPFVFVATARALDRRDGREVRWSLAAFSLLSGLAIMGDPLAMFMFLPPAALLAVVLVPLGRLAWRRAGLVLLACAAAYALGQLYQAVALYPTGRHYVREHLAPLLSNPVAAITGAVASSLPVFARDLRDHYLNIPVAGIWFLLPLAGWLMAAWRLVREVRRAAATTSTDDDTVSSDMLAIVPATSLVIGLPAAVLLQLLLVGYTGLAHSRQFVAFLFLGILVFLLLAGRAAARWRAHDAVTRSRIDLAGAAVVGCAAVGFLFRTTPEVATKPTVWHAIPDRADAVASMAREAGVSRLMVNYWLAIPLAVRHPDLEVDSYFGDIVYLEPRIRDPVVYRGGAIEGYVVEPLSLRESRLVELFGPPEKSLFRTTSGNETVKLLVFAGDKPRTYNQWVTSYAPAIHGNRATFPASTLAHLLPPQVGNSSYRLTADADTPTVRAAHTLISLWPGSCELVFRFSGATKPDAVLVTLLNGTERLLDALPVAVAPTTGEARVAVDIPREVDPQSFGELVVDATGLTGPSADAAFVFEDLTIVKR